MTKRRPRASLYARLSVAADAENVSLDGMVADMRTLAEREGLEVLEPVHVDDGRSGGFRDRDEFTAWLDDARSGRADVLMAYHTDRLTREGLNVAASILDVVEGKNPDTGRPAHRPVRLLDCSGIDSAQGDAFRFRFVMQAEIGRSERERIRQRSRDRARRLSRAGRWGGEPCRSDIALSTTRRVPERRWPLSPPRPLPSVTLPTLSCPATLLTALPGA